MSQTWKLGYLGQSGIRFGLGSVTLYTDPYLTESVAENDGPHLRRLTPVPFRPEEVRDADCVFISHDHLDHCDPETLRPISESSPQATFVGPPPVMRILRGIGISNSRLIVAEERWLDLGDGVRLHPVPAAHPALSRDSEGLPTQAGAVIEASGTRCYFAGDTSVHPEVLEAVKALGPITAGFIPVNEPSYYRERQGIIGNMSVRDAFGMAEELEFNILVPIHWDLFQPNRVFQEEIQLLFDRVRPSFELKFRPATLQSS